MPTTLIPDTGIGPYEILSALGAGGMGKVYRATDTNLKRQVTIKVLPASVAIDAERLARIRREAEVLPALNHPNIAQVHGLEKSDGMQDYSVARTSARRLSSGAEDPFWDPRCRARTRRPARQRE